MKPAIKISISSTDRIQTTNKRLQNGKNIAIFHIDGNIRIDRLWTQVLASCMLMHLHA